MRIQSRHWRGRRVIELAAREGFSDIVITVFGYWGAESRGTLESSAQSRGIRHLSARHVVPTVTPFNAVDRRHVTQVPRAVRRLAPRWSIVRSWKYQAK